MRGCLNLCKGKGQSFMFLRIFFQTVINLFYRRGPTASLGGGGGNQTTNQYPTAFRMYTIVWFGAEGPNQYAYLNLYSHLRFSGVGSRVCVCGEGGGAFTKT